MRSQKHKLRTKEDRRFYVLDETKSGILCLSKNINSKWYIGERNMEEKMKCKKHNVELQETWWGDKDFCPYCDEEESIMKQETN